jgi:isopenicillin N synthase-like dioxygenase
MQSGGGSLGEGKNNYREKQDEFQNMVAPHALTLLAALALPLQLAAQDGAKRHHHHQYHHYQLIDPGTFGSPRRTGQAAVDERASGEWES